MRIALDARMLTGYTGIERYLRRLLADLPQVAPHLDLTAMVRPADVPVLRALTPDVRPVAVDAAPFSAGEQVAVAQAMRRLSVDLVHFPAPNAPVVPVGARVTTFHDLTPLDHSGARGLVPRGKRRVFRAVMKRGVSTSRLLLVPSAATATRLVAGFPRATGKVRITPLGAPPVPAEPYDLPRTSVLHVGNAFPYKNLDRLVRAFGLVHSKHPGVRLVLAGPVGEQQSHLRRLADGADLGGHVSLPGRVSEEELQRLYAQARVFALPSLSEGFGLPALEAMAHGAPVLAARATSLPEVCGDAAAYFDPHDTDDLAASLDRLLSDEVERTAMAQAGRRRVQAFDWRRTAQLTAAAYAEAVTGRAPGSGKRPPAGS